MTHCAYCQPRSERLLWQDERCRVILADEPGFLGWCRVVWQAHIRELSDLGEADRNHLMRIVSTVEAILIRHLKPAKMNLAALGTAAPHLHFHVIPRFSDDPTFPEPVWTARRHATPPQGSEDIGERLSVLFAAALGETLAARAPAV